MKSKPNYTDIRCRQLGYKNYQDYLAGDYWQEFSNKVRKHACFCCKSRSKLQIHHITYKRLGQELPEDVITVCDQCHKSIHDIKEAGTPLEKAHIIFLEKGAPPKRKSQGRERKWVHWKRLCNPALREKPCDVVDTLRAAGLMQPDGFWPTTKAVETKYARVNKGPTGKTQSLWDRKRYIQDTRNRRKQEKEERDSLVAYSHLDAEMDLRIRLPYT